MLVRQRQCLAFLFLVVSKAEVLSNLAFFFPNSVGKKLERSPNDDEADLLPGGESGTRREHTH